MDLKKIIKQIIKEEFNNNDTLLNKLLDKINKEGKSALTTDEHEYLKQYNNNNIDKALENWLLDDSEDTINPNTNEKLMFNEFDFDEEVFYIKSKLKRIIKNHFGNPTFSPGADFDGYAWKTKYKNVYLFLGDDNLYLIKRLYNEDGDVEDNDILETIISGKDFYKAVKKLK